MFKKKVTLLITILAISLVTSCSSLKNLNDNVGIINTTDDNFKECVITIATTSSSEIFLKDKINEFNSENNGYKIECIRYDEFYDKNKDNECGSTFESFTQVDNQICLDVIKGENIDIISDLSFGDAGRFNELIKKDAFIDLYPFLDSDSNLDREMLFENVLKLNEKNGKLVTIPLFFYINTLYGEKKYVGEKENWTFDDLVNQWNSMPEGSLFNGSNKKDSVYREILMPQLASFVDIENCIVKFDSSEFLKELKFINSFLPIEEYKSDPNYSVPNFVYKVNLSSFEQYHNLFFDESQNPIECTFVGYPSEDGCGAYIVPNARFGISVNSNQEKQYGAWLFIKKFLEYDYQYNYGKMMFPINYNAFSEIAKEEYSKSNEEAIYTVQGKEMVGSYFNYEEYSRLLNYINKIHKIETSIDYSITQIIEDDIFSMLQDEKSPEETALAIQNRVAILVSEKY